MDYNDPSRRQYVQNPYTTQQQPQQQQQAQSNVQTSSQYATPASAERFRQSSYIQQQPTALLSAGGASSDQVYGHPQNSQFATGASVSVQTPQYTGDLQSPNVSRQQVPQQYGQYESNVMYGLAQQAQSATHAPFDPISRYTQRPGNAPEPLASQLGVPQTAQWYLAGQSIPTGTTVPELAAPHLSSQYPSAYTQAGSSSQNYASSMIDPTQSSTHPTYTTPHVQQPGPPVDQQFSNYQAQIRTIFSHVREGSLRDMGSLLMDVSYFLLNNVEALGFTRDDDTLHDERIHMWDEFNRAWLATLQAQFDMTQEYFRTRQLREANSLMDQQSLETLARELVRLGDNIERHGLVDYQMGVAEEEIMDLLLRCLAQLDPESRTTAGDTHAEASSSVAR